MKKALAYISGTAAAIVPVAVVFANTFSVTNVNTIVEGFKSIVNAALIVLSGVAVLVFIYGVIRFVLAAGDAEKRKESRGYMIYGVIAFAVIVGLFGLTNALLSLFGIGSGGTLDVPGFN